MEENRTDDRTEELRRHWSAANTKEKFAILAQTGRFTITELCRDFGVSRKTGHKYLKRYGAEGLPGLRERSRRPKSSPSSTDGAVEKLVVKERLKHPTWGPKKIRDLLLKGKRPVNRPTLPA